VFEAVETGRRCLERLGYTVRFGDAGERIPSVTPPGASN